MTGTLFDVRAVPETLAHPAKFTAAILDVLRPLVPPGAIVLDPFAGTGRVHRIAARAVGVEIEPEWAGMQRRTVVADALALPFGAGTFDVICTSPTYGNRLADHHEAQDGSVRRSYRHTLGRPLHPHNAGAMQWGEEYRCFHLAAWCEAVRVLRAGGVFLLNVSDHVRRGVVQPVTAWHLDTLAALGLVLVDRVEVLTPRLRYGANASVRVAFETVAALGRGDQR